MNNAVARRRRIAAGLAVELDADAGHDADGRLRLDDRAHRLRSALGGVAAASRLRQAKA